MVAFLAEQQRVFSDNCVIYWAHLSRLTIFLVVLNVSLFFVSGLVTMGYYYTLVSVLFLGLSSVGMLVPTKLVRRLWYYLVYVALVGVGLYFLVASIFYWIRYGGG